MGSILRYLTEISDFFWTCQESIIYKERQQRCLYVCFWAEDFIEV